MRDMPDFWKVKKSREMFGIREQPAPPGTIPSPRPEEMTAFVVIHTRGPSDLNNDTAKLYYFKTFNEAYEKAQTLSHPWVIAQILM